MIISSTIDNKKTFNKLLRSRVSVIRFLNEEVRKAFESSFVKYYTSERFFDPTALVRFDAIDLKVSNISILKYIEKYFLENKFTNDNLLYILINNADYLLNNLVLEKIHTKYSGVKLIFFAGKKCKNLSHDYLKFDIRNILFEDYLNLNKISISKENFHLIEQYFEDFLTTRCKVETSKINATLMRICSEKHVKNDSGVFATFAYLSRGRLGVVGVNKMARSLNISPDTANRYLKYLDEYFIMDLVNRYQIKDGVYKYSPLPVLTMFGSDVDVALEDEFFRYLYHMLSGNNLEYYLVGKNFVGLVINGKILVIPNYKKKRSFDRSKLADKFESVYELVDLESIYLFLDKINNVEVKK